MVLKIFLLYLYQIIIIKANNMKAIIWKDGTITYYKNGVIVTEKLK